MINSNCALIEKRPQYTQRHDQVILQVDSASPHTANPGREVLKSLGLGNFIARAPLYRPGSIRLPPFRIDGERACRATLRRLRKSQKMGL